MCHVRHSYVSINRLYKALLFYDSGWVKIALTANKRFAATSQHAAYHLTRVRLDVVAFVSPASQGTRSGEAARKQQREREADEESNRKESNSGGEEVYINGPCVLA